MATITSAQSGLASNPNTWVGGVCPSGSGDTPVIAAGTTVTWDLSNPPTSGYTGYAGFTINGTLAAPTASGSYVLYLSTTANMTFSSSGQVLFGTSSSPVPDNVKFTFNTNTKTIDLTNVAASGFAIYGTMPQSMYAQVAVSGAVGATSITYSGPDLTADPVRPWKVGDSIRIDGINQINQSQVVVITAITSNTITFANNPLSYAKNVGSYIVFISSNIQFTSASTNGVYAISNGTGAIINRCTLSGNNIGIYNSNSHTLTSCTLSGNNYGVSAGTSHTLTNCTFSGNINSFYLGTSFTISGCIFSGSSSVVNTGTSHTLSGCTLSGNNYEFVSNIGLLLQGNTISSNAGKDYSLSNGWGNGYNNTYPATPTCQSYLNGDPNGWKRATEYNYNGVANSIIYYSNGGYGLTQAPPAGQPGGITYSLHNVMQDVRCPLEFDIPIYGFAGVPLNLTVWIISAQLPAGMTVGPRVQIIDPTQVYGSAASKLWDTPIANNTSWQTIPVSYTPTVTGPLLLRVTATNASGTYDWWYNNPAPSSGGGFQPFGQGLIAVDRR